MRAPGESQVTAMTLQAAANVAVVGQKSADLVPLHAPAATGAEQRPARADPEGRGAEAMARLQGSAGRWIVRLLALLAGLAFWHYASSTRSRLLYAVRAHPGPAPRRRSADRASLLATKFYLHIGASLRRIAISYALAAGIGITARSADGTLAVIRDIVSPYIEILRPIPAVAWIPLAILMWPTEEGSIIYITFLGALFPIVLNTIHGVEQTPEVLVRAAPVARRLAPSHLPPRRPAGRAAEHLRGPRDRHGRVLVLAARRRDHQRPVRHRLLHLERLLGHQLSGHRGRHADDRPAGRVLHGAGSGCSPARFWPGRGKAR